MTSLNSEDRTTQNSEQWSFVSAFIAVLFALFLLSGCSAAENHANDPLEGTTLSTAEVLASDESVVDLASVPDYSGSDYIDLNGGIPSFTAEEIALKDAVEVYGELDSYGRATGAFAKICTNTQPAPGSKRAKNMPDPSGWVQAYYPEIGLDHLYERSHLIAYSLTDEAVNPRDLITGTEHLNQDTMQIFERQIRDYLDASNGHDNHVLMRVTPDFRGSELVARGAQIEALSLEDDGKSICFNVYCYNVQPGIVIDYATGASTLSNSKTETNNTQTEASYVLNTNTKKFHYPDCKSVADMKAKNRKDVNATREELVSQGYDPCSRCNP